MAEAGGGRDHAGQREPEPPPGALPASSGEGDGEPVRHRLNQQGNRATNAVLHRMAITQLRCHPGARLLYDNSRRNGHTKREAMRVLKRHLSNIVYRRMLADAIHRTGQPVNMKKPLDIGASDQPRSLPAMGHSRSILRGEVRRETQ